MDNIPELPLEPLEVPTIGYCPACGYEIYQGEPVEHDGQGDLCHLGCAGGIFDGGGDE